MTRQGDARVTRIALSGKEEGKPLSRPSDPPLLIVQDYVFRSQEDEQDEQDEQDGQDEQEKRDKEDEEDEEERRKSEGMREQQLRHREITRWLWKWPRSSEQALTNDGGNFYYFRCRPIREARQSALRLREPSSRMCFTYILRRPRGERYAPLDKWLRGFIRPTF